MKKRTLGKSDLSVAPIAFGANVFGWTLNEQDSFRILDEFVDNDFNLIDTADTYSTWVPGNSGGESEIIIGNWIKQGGKRERIILATKVGGDMGEGALAIDARAGEAADPVAAAGAGFDALLLAHASPVTASGSPGRSPTISLAGTRLSAQPIQR